MAGASGALNNSCLFAAIVVSFFSPMPSPVPTKKPARSKVTRTAVDRV